MILSVNFHLCSQISSIITTFSLISCSQRQDKVVTLHRGEEGVLKGKKKEQAERSVCFRSSVPRFPLSETSGIWEGRRNKKQGGEERKKNKDRSAAQRGGGRAHTHTRTHTLETEEVSDVVSRALFVSLERSRRESALLGVCLSGDVSNFPCSSGATRCFGIRGPRCVANKSGEGGAGVRERRGDWESAAADGWWWGHLFTGPSECSF